MHSQRGVSGKGVEEQATCSAVVVGLVTTRCLDRPQEPQKVRPPQQGQAARTEARTKRYTQKAS